MKSTKLLLLGLGAAILFFILNNKHERKIEKHALENLNLQLVGVVDSVDKLNGYNGTGVIKLKIITSNIKYYDPRRHLDYYYCIIKNGIAEVYDGSADNLYRGDTVKINTKAKVITWTHDRNEKQSATIWINDSDSFYDYIKKYHQRL